MSQHTDWYKLTKRFETSTGLS